MPGALLLLRRLYLRPPCPLCRRDPRQTSLAELWLAPRRGAARPNTPERLHRHVDSAHLVEQALPPCLQHLHCIAVDSSLLFEKSVRIM